MTLTRLDGSFRVIAFGLESSRLKGSSTLTADYRPWLGLSNDPPCSLRIDRRREAIAPQAKASSLWLEERVAPQVVRQGAAAGGCPF